MTELKNDLLIRAARRERTERTPVWMMRQAGRTDPDYVALRRRADQPLESLFADADLAAEISLLPKRIGVDAIILFQDILTPLAPMGARFVFRPGPQLATPVRSISDVNALQSYDPCSELQFIPRAIRLVRTALDGELPLLGFAGAPWTLAAFLLEGGSPSRSSPHIECMMRDDPVTLHRLLAMLSDMTVDYLTMQIEAGVDAVQLFESFADALSPQQYEEFAHPYHVRIFSGLQRRVPTILFVKDHTALDLMASSGADVLSIDTCVDLADAKAHLCDRVAFQGNVNNKLLVTGSLEEIDEAVHACIQAGGHEGHILNLSHGLLKETPFENVRRFVHAAKQYGHAAGSLNPATREM